ncbi:MAG: hypothetical protein HKN91_12160 [Acidimicrobiia bacterium]|nr:hypothetical protein [Acidimicrobiia bacterium]
MEVAALAVAVLPITLAESVRRVLDATALFYRRANGAPQVATSVVILDFFAAVAPEPAGVPRRVGGGA